nr:peptide chain release factor N(5)-glutamine methyltransferase [uncultured Leptotrichia sp.]
MNNLLEILNKSVDYLEKRKIKEARLKVESILAEVLSMQRIMLYANFERELSQKEIAKIKEKLHDILKKDEYKYDTITVEKEENLKMLLDKSVSFLEKNEIPEARLKAEIIFSNVLGIERMMLFTKYKDEIDEEKKNKIREYIHKIGKEKFPIQYLLNEQEFYGRSFYVDKGVLIPRLDTEVLVEKALNILNKGSIEEPKVLDIGVGSGVIGITIALEVPTSKIMGVDISEKALEISSKNKKILKAGNIKFIKSDLFENIEYKKFNMIVSNPPYISSDETDVMSEDALLHEPSEALFAGSEGLYFYNSISKKAMEYLDDNGYLLFEIGYKQGEIVAKIMETYGFKNVEIAKDLAGNDRVVVGQKLSS